MKTKNLMLIAGIVISGIISFNATAQITIAIKKSNGLEGKMYITADKMKIKSRANAQFAQQKSQEQLNKMAVTDVSQDKTYLATQGVSNEEELRQKKIKKLKGEIGNAEAGQNQQPTPEREKYIKDKKAELAQMEAGGDVMAGNDGRELQKNMQDEDKRKLAAEEIGKETAEKTMEIEIIRFDQNKMIFIHPNNMNYDESTTAEIKKKRTKDQKPMPMTGAITKTAVTNNINGENCILYLGIINYSNIPYVTDSIWISTSNPALGQQYWNAIKKYNDEVGGPKEKDMAEAMMNADYLQLVYALPGIPLKRSTSVKGQPATITTITVLSTTPIDAKEFEVAAGMKKK